MAAKTERIKGLDATLFKDGTRPIYVLSDGRFAVKWGDDWFVKPSLRSVENKINSERPCLKIFSAGFGSESVQVVEAAEFNRKIIDRDGKKHYPGYGDNWYIFDEGKVKALTAFLARYKKTTEALREEFHQIIKGSERVSQFNFKDKLAGERDPTDVEDYEPEEEG